MFVCNASLCLSGGSPDNCFDWHKFGSRLHVVEGFYVACLVSVGKEAENSSGWIPRG